MLISDLIIGGISGMVAISVIEPLFYFKNCQQQWKPISRNVKVWYRGLPINMAGSIPSLAVQNASFEYFRTQYDPLLSSVLAGICSSPITCIREFAVLQQQNTGYFLWKIPFKFSLRAIFPIVCRTNIQSISMFYIIPQGWSPFLLGALLTLITQPLDTWKTWIQADSKIRKGLYRGWFPRWLGVSTTFLIVTQVKKFLTSL